MLIREREACGLVDEEIADPFKPESAVHAANPLGKVPVLILPGRLPIIDSPLIVEYLDTSLPGIASLSPSGEARWQSLRQQALADGIMDAAVAIVFEKARTDTAPSGRWLQRWQQAIVAGVSELEKELDHLRPVPDVGAIAVACALTYLDFRHGGLNWRAGAEGLARWLEEVVQRPSMIATQPVQ